MAGKNAKGNNESMLSTVLSVVKDNVLGHITETIKENINRLERKVFEAMLSLFMLVLGLIFLLVALAFFAHYYLGLDFALVFFLIGIVLVIAASMLNRSAKI